MNTAIAPAAWRRDGSSLVSVIPAQDGNSPAGRATLEPIRAAAGDDAVTGGEAAQSADFLDAVYGGFPLVVALVPGLTFLLLARAFRSVVRPLEAVALNLLSVAAAWGLMVIVWQHGWGSETILGIQATHAINVEMPIVVFAFLFGISTRCSSSAGCARASTAPARPRPPSSRLPRRAARVLRAASKPAPASA